ncbi:hypothetical protein DAI22_07g101100 [Oryza sativa Japonica Group]|nr:hypothetical protein DAI22_07g101100 [Oryza sativa Japonica Group]
MAFYCLYFKIYIYILKYRKYILSQTKYITVTAWLPFFLDYFFFNSTLGNYLLVLKFYTNN